MEQALSTIRPTAPFFWRTHTGAEVDLLWHEGGAALGMEFKYCDAPTITRSMRMGIDDLNLQQLWVVYPGETAYQLDDRITVIPVSRLPGLY